jgi:NAD(P)-dependent dehydrogenase (short-subunit alcohol dehydrogenase family)
LGPGVLGICLDVTDRRAWQDAKLRTENLLGAVDILVNNAGVTPDWNEMADMPPEHFDRVVSVMLTGVYNGIHTFASALREQRRGHITNTASLNGLVPVTRTGAYTAAKYGVVGMSEVLRSELQPYGVGVSVLCPGSVRTNLLEGGSSVPPARVRSAIDAGIDPRLVGERVVEAIRRNELYVITHGQHRGIVARRAAELLSAFDSAVALGS